METPEFLLHFSEDPTIAVFHPRVAPTQQIEGEWVWADAVETSPRYWFPRDCPRGTWWPTDHPEGPRVHAIEWSWFDRFVACELYAYRMPAATFERTSGGWLSPTSVTPLGVEPVGPLLDKHRHAGVELRIVPDGALLALWDDVIKRPGLAFSGIRLKNATRATRGPS
ncbi:MAG TPA: hypothetical protein VFB78_16310 [Acidimicrobiales bacterium]|nr:hypothetical protein [Acidimicrobiales bacterium]